MSEPMIPPASFLQSIKRNILVGVLAIIPLWITIILVGAVLSFVRQQTAPVFEQALRSVAPGSTAFQQLADASWFQTVLAVGLLLVLFYIVGWLTSRWVGRQLMSLVDNLMERIPIAKSIYSAIKGMTDAMKPTSEKNSKVVLINFPSPEMKSIGLVTKTIEDSVTGEQLSVVFVPTSPTPTSGYVEIVPTRELIAIDWTVEQAMSFLMSGGTDIATPLSVVKAFKNQTSTET